MKLEIARTDGKKCIVTAETKKTMDCPDGVHAYYDIAYTLDGETVHSTGSSNRSTAPSPIDALDWIQEISVYDYDNPDAEEHRGMFLGYLITWSKSDKGAQRGTVNSVSCAWIRIKKTNRELLVHALDQIVLD